MATAKQAYKPLDADELESAIQARARELWVEAGRPADRCADDFRSEINTGEFYRFESKDGCVFIYRRDGTANTKEALSFLKDWVTSLIQLETGALAVIGLAAGFKEILTSPGTPPHSGGAAAAIPLSAKIFAGLELALIFLSGVSILVSMAFGLAILISLPGAAQRFPMNPAARQSDIFTLKNEARYPSFLDNANRFRDWFFAGVIIFALFSLVRLIEQFYRILSG